MSRSYRVVLTMEVRVADRARILRQSQGEAPLDALLTYVRNNLASVENAGGFWVPPDTITISLASDP